MINKNIYLDNHSSTQIDERVYKKMVPFLTNIFGNPHSESHSHGWISNKFVDLSRLKIALKIKKALPSSRESFQNNTEIHSCKTVMIQHLLPHSVTYHI